MNSIVAELLVNRYVNSVLVESDFDRIERKC